MSRFVLVHSPLVGASSWRPAARRLGDDTIVPSLAGFAAAAPPRWRYAVDAVVAAVGDASDVTLVGHSGAGALLPPITDALGDVVAAIVFVDAPLPPASGTASPVPPDFRDFLADLAGPDGTLPPWSRWWGEDAMQTLVPDASLRAALEADMERLPLAYFDEVVPVPAGWDARRVAYVQLSAVCEPDANDARERGWPVERIDGTHLDLATRPDVVCDAIFRALGR